MYGYEKTEYCDEVNRVLCIPYDSYEVSDWEGLRSNYFKYSLLREETQKKLSEIGVVEEVNITDYLDMDAMLLYCIEEGNWCEDGRKVIFKSEKDRQAYAKAVNKYLQYSILLSELLEYKELEAYYLKAYDRLDYEALGVF